MKQRDEKYAAIINPEFLFNTDKKFKSFFAPWVYVYIRLDYIGNLNFKPQSFYKIDRKSICDFFGIPNGTVTRVFKELIGEGLLEEKCSEYRLIKDELIYPYKKKEEERQYPEYVQVFNNFFIDFTVLLRERFEEFKKQPRALMKVVQVFHYLITKNHHIMTAIPKFVSKETYKSISKALHHDENYVKGYLGVLETIGYIEYDTDGNIITVFGYGYHEPFEETKTKQLNLKDKLSDFTNEEVEQPQVYNNAVSEYIEENEQLQEYNTVIDNIDEVEQPQAFNSAVNENNEKVEQVIYTEQRKPVPISDNERIGYILTMGKGEAKRTKELLERFKISEDSIRAYIATN